MNKITLILDSHALSQSQQCLKNYWFENIRNIEPINNNRGLTRGTIFHQALDEYYEGLKKGDNLTELVKNIYSKIMSIKDIEQDEAFFLANRFTQYHIYWRSKDWTEVIATEKGFSKLLYEDDKYRFIYEGKIDLIVKITDQLCWIDHKTQLYNYDRTSYTNQFLGYTWALGYNLGILNIIMTKQEENPNNFERRSTYYSNRLIQDWKHETIKWCKYLADIMYKASQIEDEYNLFPKQLAACERKYGLCSYLPICSVCTSRDAAEIVIGHQFKEKKEYWKPW